MPRKQGSWNREVRDERRKLAERLLAAGVPVAAVARQLQMSPRWVAQVKRALQQSSNDAGTAME
jgi:hypothetical protein